MKRNFKCSNHRSPVPISLSIQNNVEGWQMATALKDVSDNEFQVIMVEITMYRGPTHIFFSLFIASLMWLLSFSLFWLAFTLCMRRRKVEPPTIAVGTSMIFALPAIRNVQPGSPPIGCTADFIGFFWALMLVSAGSLILLLNYIKMYKADPIVLKEILVDNSELLEENEQKATKEQRYNEEKKSLVSDIEMNVININ